jgi:hypothetical protein
MAEQRQRKMPVDSSSGGCVSRAFTQGCESPVMASAAIGALNFHLVATAFVRVPELRDEASLRAGDLEFAVHREDGKAFLIVDHRSGRDCAQPARVELWEPAARPETDLSYLLLLADRRASQGASPVEPEPSLAGMVERLLTGCASG